MLKLFSFPEVEHAESGKETTVVSNKTRPHPISLVNFDMF
jgi:hypothetical protein